MDKGDDATVGGGEEGVGANGRRQNLKSLVLLFVEVSFKCSL